MRRSGECITLDEPLSGERRELAIRNHPTMAGLFWRHVESLHGAMVAQAFRSRGRRGTHRREVVRHPEFAVEAALTWEPVGSEMRGGRMPDFTWLPANQAASEDVEAVFAPGAPASAVARR